MPKDEWAKAKVNDRVRRQQNKSRSKWHHKSKPKKEVRPSWFLPAGTPVQVQKPNETAWTEMTTTKEHSFTERTVAGDYAIVLFKNHKIMAPLSKFTKFFPRAMSARERRRAEWMDRSRTHSYENQ